MHLEYLSDGPAIVVGECRRHESGWDWEHGTAARVLKMTGRKLTWYNLFMTEPERWSALAARKSVAAFPEHPRHLPVLLLGTRVCAAFGLDRPEWLGWYATEAAPLALAVPHPSGLNRWWNDLDNRVNAERQLFVIGRGFRPKDKDVKGRSL
jgi:hypothetical protein